MNENVSVLVEFSDSDNAENMWTAAFPQAETFVKETLTAAWRFAGKQGIAIPDGTPEITVFLTDDEGIRKINKQYRNADKATNVLSFPAIEQGINFTADMTYLAGDIFISLTTTAKESDDEGKTLAEHLAHLLIHSCLHLLGFDHENDADAEKMEALETKFLQQMGIKNPYEDS